MNSMYVCVQERDTVTGLASIDTCTAPIRHFTKIGLPRCET